jgi:hypothetical protein
VSERARFAAGEAVRARSVDPWHHTRVPRYVRGHTGRVVDVAGKWPLADDMALRSAQPRVEAVYTVAFAARELWGEGEHDVMLDLWESYLEPCGAESREEDGS